MPQQNTAEPSHHIAGLTSQQQWLNDEKEELKVQEKKLELKEKKLEDEKIKLENEKIKLEDEKIKLENEKIKLEDEKTELTDEKKELKDEKIKFQADCKMLFELLEKEGLSGDQIRAGVPTFLKMKLGAIDYNDIDVAKARIFDLVKDYNKDIDERIKDVNERIDERIKDVNGRIKDVNERIKDVNERIKDVNERINKKDTEIGKIRDLLLKLTYEHSSYVPRTRKDQKAGDDGRQEDVIAELVSAVKGLGISMHAMKEQLPSVVVGHVITPSTASRDRDVSAKVFDAVGLTLKPTDDEGVYDLPGHLEENTLWNFHWSWTANENDDRVLERTSYAQVLKFLRSLGILAEDVSEGQNCVKKVLYNSVIYTPRKSNPLQVKGQRVILCHRVAGRTDIVGLTQDRNNGEITKSMVKFAIEIKTPKGYQKSNDGCLFEAQLQLIGLNAFNVFGSPPVVLTNLARIHQVLYLAYKDDGWGYVIRRRKCNSFPAAIHFAQQKASEASISDDFSRPMTPEAGSE